MDSKSSNPRQGHSMILLAVCLFIVASSYILVFWRPSYPDKTMVKFQDSNIASKINDIVENDNRIEKLEGTGEFLDYASTTTEKQMDTKRRILTKTHYPLTLSSPYVINNANICVGIQNLTFLIMVHTAPGHIQRRRSIRETWANKNLFKHINMRIVFLFGMPSDRQTQVSIENESTVYKDLVQGNFKDAYKNLTHKGVLGYRWISEHCNNSKLIIKVDDDVFVNVFKLVDYYLPKYGAKPKRFLCHVSYSGAIQRGKYSKWAAEDDDFRGRNYYPIYCLGYAVFITPDLITAMYRAAHFTPFFWVDDVYLFGLLPKNIKDVRWENIGYDFTLSEKAGLESYELSGQSRYVVTAARRDGVMERLWFAALSLMTDSNRKLINADLLTAVDELIKAKTADSHS